MMTGWTRVESPFHAGEKAVHDRLGIHAKIDAQVRRAGIRDYLPEQHREFFPQLPFLTLAHVDAHGQPWATMRVGKPGFINSPDAHTLHIGAPMLAGDPSGVVHTGDWIGTLGIQLFTHRRNRANGVVQAADGSGFTLDVHQSFGNCGKYIQERIAQVIDGDATAQVTVREATELNDADATLVTHADTFFIASAWLDAGAGVARGADISHKGGRPGFVRVDNAHTLTVPDFVGNSYYNTIGNLALNPHAGLLFVDFATRDLLYLAVRAEILWNDPETRYFAGALRLLRFHLLRVHRSCAALPLRWTTPRYARELPRTGTWPEATQAKRTNAQTVAT